VKIFKSLYKKVDYHFFDRHKSLFLSMTKTFCSASLLGEQEQPSNPSAPPKSLSVDEPNRRLRTPPPPKIAASAEAARNHTLKKQPQTPVKYDMVSGPYSQNTIS
jgi:hypothetical protein